MLASASGPLGALLVIAPLAAIPIVAIVGIPQFTPVAASPADEEEISDLGEVSSSPAAPRPAKRRSADDLFAPLPGSGPTQPTAGQFESVYGSRGTEASRRPGPAGAAPAKPETNHDAFDNWEVDSSMARGSEELSEFERNDPRERASNESLGEVPAGAGRRSPANELSKPARPAGRNSGSAASGTGRIDANGFKAGLLPDNQRGASNPAANPLPRKREPMATDLSGTMNAPGDLRSGMEVPLDQAAAGLPMMHPEQSRWQAVSARIKELGIRKYRLEAQIEEPRFVFRCVFAAAENAQVTQLFEADAETPIEAVEQVLQQVDEWLQNRESTTSRFLN